ncbi:hypothetical protein PhCBS80983_g04591 [Powellomyces hirtus]|uniref:Protein HIR n=1 Tax=Powellomyces hirtus TaxID=109895 RepID=A0A507DX80_9FUNG|nr:hypothetical protein PhCBS80983_g04591 [Powellomyces hirtus]
MYIFTPQWITHTNEKSHKTPIYSLAVHPLGKRLATGGQDSKVKLWNTAPVYEETLERDPDTPKLLATLAAHSGSVLCVRWSNDEGLYLASGSDDYKIVLWKHDNSNISRNLLGESDAGPPTESWRAVKVLRGHESDVADLAWSPDNTYLASCGFETTIYIWDGKTFNLLQKLHAHTAFVKGVTWDPVGKYLASQSDDKTTKIWRVSDWTEEKSITKPYEAAASTTFFRRLSWSPEGSCIVTANGESGNRPVAPIIQRDGWDAEVNLVGHSGPIECAQFNPQLFDIPAQDGKGTTVTGVCAVGSQDNTISVWRTSNAHAVTVNREFFQHSILDLSWSPDGDCLFACSYDGTVGVLAFSDGDLGTRLPASEKERVLNTLGVKRKAVIESVSQLGLEETNRVAEKEASSSRISALLGNGSSVVSTPTKPFTAPRPVTNSTPTPSTSTQKVSQTPDGRKRIKPIFLSTGLEPNEGFMTPQTPVPFSGAPQQSSDASENLIGSGGIPIGTGKRRKLNGENGHAPTNGALHSTESGNPAVQYVLPTVMETQQPVNLAIPAVQSSIVIQIPAGKGSNPYSLECDNRQKPAKIMCSKGSELVWADFIHSPAIHVTGTPSFVAVACEDGSLFTYSPAGRRMLPCIALEGAASFVTSQGDYLMCLTAVGTINVWNIVRQTTAIHRSSIIHLLRAPFKTSDDSLSTNSTPRITIKSAYLKKEGIPILTTTLNDSYTYHPTMQVWMKVGDSSEPVDMMNGGGAAYAGSKTLSQLENQMACKATLRLPKEYMTCLQRYAVKLADEGAITKSQELCDELMGPRSSSSLSIGNRRNPNEWDPLILGMPKRTLLSSIIPPLSKNRSLQRTLEHYKTTLAEIREEEHHKSMQL